LCSSGFSIRKCLSAKLSGNENKAPERDEKILFEISGVKKKKGD
jgi:hypothetical protein